ncbi:uncharacterized protein LOC113400285 [Vanessa tameamea]|uniref:Uncharacterized protein LOC113400285 n=1 Tax=Vanessa tameamea TaxID=334116 RepID=A0A8B8IHQ4_VANTA|nr:uncharacterized protein LOC113400285 [Vanessa tameamea]
MVLSGASYLFSPTDFHKNPVSGFVKIKVLKNTKYNNIFFTVCKVCEETMASIPPSAFSAGRIRETQRDMKVSNIKKGVEPQKYFHTKLMELTPLKYNSKLMNSIWGFYNRYSPHNVKKINDALPFNAELQQSAVNSPNKNETTITLPKAKLDNVWASFNTSQSH